MTALFEEVLIPAQQINLGRQHIHPSATFKVTLLLSLQTALKEARRRECGLHGMQDADIDCSEGRDMVQSGSNHSLLKGQPPANG